MRNVIAAAFAAALLIAPVSPAHAGPATAGLTAQCWTPQQLAGRPDEKAAHFTRRDTAMPATTGLQLPPVATRGTVRRVKLPPGKKLVALTFDLCEAVGEVAGYDGAVIDYLRANDVKATFFAGGKWLLDHSDRSAQLIADPRFEVGTHGWAHVNLHVASGKAVTDEILGGLAAHATIREQAAGMSCVRDASKAALNHLRAKPKLFRYPFGTCHAEAMQAVADSGLIAIQWDVLTGDPDRNATAQSIARGVLGSVKPGSIIVAHANGRGWQTSNALPILVPELRKRGYEFVTVSELIAAGEPEVASSCYERRPGDNNRYDIVQIRRNRAAAKQGQSPTTPPRKPTTWPTVLDPR